MLFILSGDTESGKTTWLCDFVTFLNKQNVNVAGVLAPGEWEQAPGQSNKKIKVGIKNVLLPAGKTLKIATRKISDDLDYSANCAQHIQKQPDNVKYKPKKWRFDETAFKQVNDYFATLKTSCQKALLIIDELGPKELEYDEGLTNATELLESGSSDIYNDAIIVVRQHLVEIAKDKFSEWGESLIINAQTCFGSVLDKLSL